MGKGKKVEWKSYSNFEGMEMNSDSVRRLKPWRNIINLHKFGSVIYYWFICRA
jgi:hypothetical protein